jgi:hypothetical protein
MVSLTGRTVRLTFAAALPPLSIAIAALAVSASLSMGGMVRSASRVAAATA